MVQEEKKKVVFPFLFFELGPPETDPNKARASHKRDPHKTYSPRQLSGLAPYTLTIKPDTYATA